MAGGDLTIADELTDQTRARIPDFVREYVKTKNVVAAIQRARVQNPEYRMSVWAERLLADPSIVRMIDIETLKQQGQRSSREYTRESIADDFQEIYEQAITAGDLSPAVSAKAKQAEVLGLMEKNVRVTVTTNVSDMSMEDLERELARLTEAGVVDLSAVERDDGSVVYE
jgi:hypothetical protein